MRSIKKVIFGITSLGIGGAERVLVDIVNKLVQNYEVTIFSIYDNGELKKDLNPEVNFKSLYKCRYEDLNAIQKKWSPIRILLLKNQIYKKYINENFDVEIAFLEGPITRLFSRKSDRKKIVWIHNDIQQVFGAGLKSKIKKIIDKKIYNKYDKIVFVSKDNKESFKKIYTDIEEKKLNVIYNYIDDQLIKSKSKNLKFPEEFRNSNNLKFVSVCRLVEQKAIDRYIKVHKRLIREGYKHEVFVIGDGPDKFKLEKLINQESVENTFRLLGKKEKPYSYIKYADYFCLLSYFEGYGMVLEEAKILNKNIIITDTAAREAIDGYPKASILENNEDAIYEGLKAIILEKKSNQKDEIVYNNSSRIDEIRNLIEK